jgi:hypothetical protein
MTFHGFFDGQCFFMANCHALQTFETFLAGEAPPIEILRDWQVKRTHFLATLAGDTAGFVDHKAVLIFSYGTDPSTDRAECAPTSMTKENSQQDTQRRSCCAHEPKKMTDVLGSERRLRSLPEKKSKQSREDNPTKRGILEKGRNIFTEAYVAKDSIIKRSAWTCVPTDVSSSL